MIDIIDRQLAFNTNHADRVGPPKGIVLHHAAGDGSVDDVHSFHKHQNGWAGIGYHFYVRKDGRVYRGRPERWLGAHTTGHNDMIGICAEGNFESETMSAAQQRAVMALVADVRKRYGELDVFGHRDLDATTCPGKNYPLASIESGRSPAQRDLVLLFQRAALSDGLSLPQYGADGAWGPETASAAVMIMPYGQTGERVRLLQRRLITLGFDLGRGADDGIFGDDTLAAVKAYQAKNALAVDGIVGIETWKSLLEVTA